MKRTFLIYIQLFLVFTLFAQIPTGYYTAAEGKMEAALKSQLASIISANYDDNGYDGLYNIYKTSDNLPNGKVWDMYSLKANGTADYYFTHSSNTCGSYGGEGDCYNREHTFCDSWLGAATPQRSDAHHLIPTDGYVNNRRSSFPHGKVGSASWTSSNGSKLGSSDASTGYSGTVFEPIDEYKGDFARMYFYVATRYESKIAGWVNNGSAGEILAGNTYPAYKSWFLNLMLAWHALDPVSAKEINRNNVIYGFQNNRNPYIDYPSLADHVWGSKKTQPWSSTSTNSAYLTSPVSSSPISVGKVVYQQSKVTNVEIKAYNLTGSITISVAGTNASLFTVSKSSLTKAEAEAGYTLKLTYNAQSVGVHSAQLQITGGGLTAVTVQISAESSDSFMALAATNINYAGFTANWTASGVATNYSLDVYSVQSSGTGTTTNLVEEEFNNGLPSTWTSEGYTDNVTTGYMRLASGSQIGKITTPALNLSKTTTLSVRAKQYGSDTGAALTAIVDAQSLAVWVTSATDQTFTVEVPPATASSKISLSAASGTGKRVYVDNVKVTTIGTTQSNVSVSGYPLLTGNVLSYNVIGLQADSTYYYTVSTQGGIVTKSDAIAVRTANIAALLLPQNEYFKWKRKASGINILGLPEIYSIKVYNLLGNEISTLTQNEGSEVYLPTKGIYLIRISAENKNFTQKIVF